jgi:hypothetical protein
MDNEKEEPTFDLDRVLCPSCLNCAGPLAVLSTYAGLCASILEEGRCWVAVGVAPALSAAWCSENCVALLNR